MNSRATFRELLKWDTDEPNKELLLRIIEDGICPTQFPDFKQDDCRPKKTGKKAMHVFFVGMQHYMTRS